MDISTLFPDKTIFFPYNVDFDLIFDIHIEFLW